MSASPPQHQRWKKRLYSLQNSFRSSIRSKSQHSIKDSDAQASVTKTNSKHSSKGSKSLDNLDGDVRRRENRAEQKHVELSKVMQKHDNYNGMSTSRVHSMHGKTLSDTHITHNRRKCSSNNNVNDLEKDGVHSRTAHSPDLTLNESSIENNTSSLMKTSLSRPKSLSVLSSLFNRSSGQRTDSKRDRGKHRTQCNSKESSNCASNTISKTSDDYCSVVDSEDEFLDTDGSFVKGKKYYSLKRSKASPIFPPNSERARKPFKLREKSKTFCGVQEPVGLESASNLGTSQKSRKVPRKKAVSLLVPLSSSSLELLQKQPMRKHRVQQDGTNDTHLRYNGAIITDIRCITRTSELTMSNYSSVPSLGVTYIDNNGVEKTLVIITGNTTQSCYDLLKQNERVPISLKYRRGLETTKELVRMGNQTGTLERSASFGNILDKRGSLQPSNSTPDIFARRSSCTLSTDSGAKKNRRMSAVLKGLSLKRHTMSANSKNLGKKDKKSRKDQAKIEEECNSNLGLRLAGRNDSLSRSMESLSKLHKSNLESSSNYENGGSLFREKVTYDHTSHYASTRARLNVSKTASTSLDDFLTDSDSSSVHSIDSWIDSPDYKTIITRRGSSTKTSAIYTEECTKTSQKYSGASSLSAEDLLNTSTSRESTSSHRTTILYHSTPIEKMSTLERERSKSAVSDDPEVPPPVRPRIQSLEELCPVKAEVILRKKKSIASRKVRLKHSLSMNSEEDVLEDTTEKRYSFEMSDLTNGHVIIDPPAPLTDFQSNESTLDSQESLNDNGSSSSLSDKHLSPSYVSPLKASIEDISKSPTIHEEIEKSDNDTVILLSSDDCKSKSLLRRLGRSTGDLSFEPGSTWKRNQLAEMYSGNVEEMDVPEAFAEALWDHVTMDPEELSFKAGDIITVISMTNIDWWFGQVGELFGWFPAPFVRVRVSQTLDELENHLAPPIRTRRFTNEGLLTKDVVRTRVVNEILDTEKSYVKNLRDVVEGYLRQAQKRNDMFSEEEIYLLFSNIEEIYTFHQKLLAEMKKCYVKNDPCSTLIGAVFLENTQGFNIYSEYCNNHPQAIAEFKHFNEKTKYKQFFEACRLLQGMINISLDGFLLTPVQKICKYPLQLAELLKHTHKTHKDYEPVRQALESMKNVASFINERKRKVENISKIAKWQSTIEGWEGENVLERSSELIHSGEVHKVFNGTTQERVCFLFDHQLIYCKKDILRKNGLTYKGRIDMDLARIDWLQDGEETYKNEPLNNAWRILDTADSKWYVVFTKKPEDKQKWKDAFYKEKMIANEEAQAGVAISQSTRRAVMRSARSSIKGRKATEKREKFFDRSPSQTDFLKSPPSPTLRLPPAVSSADFIKEEDPAFKENVLGFLQRTSALRRSFGLRGSKRNHKDKRISSVF